MNHRYTFIALVLIGAVVLCLVVLSSRVHRPRSKPTPGRLSHAH